MRYCLLLFFLWNSGFLLFGQALSTADYKQIKKEVWQTVEKRNTSWAENDEEGHFALYHPDFRRWSVHNPTLLTKDVFKGFWDQIKSTEQVISLQVIPEEMQIFQNGTLAIAHYTIDETYEWIAADGVNGKGEMVKKGTRKKGNLRFSDIYIKEDGKWWYVGGHRDGAFLR